MSSRASLNHVYRTVWNESTGTMVAVAEVDSGRGRTSAASVGSTYRFQAHKLVHLSALAVGVALAWGALAGNAFANPSGGVVVAGQATMANSGSQLLVTTQNGAGTNHSAINWQSFSIPSGSTTRFQQPNALSTVINRVVTNTPSAIFGNLSSNGNVVLVNQSGIAVGAGAVVDTAGFTASSLRMTDADALAGRMRFGDASSATNGVSVQGSILARSGDVVLLGANVDTAKDALVKAPNGTTILAAGQQIEITGRGLEGIRLQVQAPQDQVVNLGTLEGEAVGIFAGTLRHSGLIQATHASLEGGKVVLKASGDAFVEGAGQIVAAGTAGGSADILGNRVAVADQAAIDVSGVQGGGSVRVGGDYQGKNADVSNAEFVYFGPQASIKADASDNGNGGRVIVWADDTTRAHGTISAKGGVLGGDGGFVETSGKQSLSIAGARVDTRASLGQTGLWLLDPDSIDIVATGPSTNISGVTDFTAASTGPSTLYVSDLLSALSSTNASVTAVDSLTVSTPISSIGYGSLLLKANNGPLTVDHQISLSNGSLALESTNSNISLGASVSSSSGSISLKSGGSISQSSGTISSLSLAVDAGGTVLLNSANAVPTIAAHVASGSFSYKSAVGFTVGAINSVTGVSTNGGAIALEAPSIVLNESINSAAGPVSLTLLGGAVTQNTASTARIAAGSLSLISVFNATLNNDFNSVGTLNVTGSGTDPILFSNAGSFALGPVTSGGDLTLKSNGGSISQTGGLSLGGYLTVQAGGGNVALTNSANAAVDIGSISAGSFALTTNGNISINFGGIIATSGGVDISSTAGSLSSGEGISASGGPVKLSGKLGLTLGGLGGISSTAAGNAVILATGGPMLVSTPVTTSGPGGRWLAYAPIVGSNTFPAGMAFKQYNATVGSPILGTGNGVLLADAPILTLSSNTLTGSLSKVYDGEVSVNLSDLTLPTVTGGGIDGDVISGAVLSGGTAGLDDKNVGTGKLVTASGVNVTGVLSGSMPVYGYSIPATLSGNVATVTQRPTSVWTGGGNGGTWSSAGNWDALPDGENVANVMIPAGAGPIVFDDSVGPTSLQSLTSGSPILISGGALKIADDLNLAGFSQTGGVFNGRNLKVVGSFNQTGGSVDMSAINVLTPSGDIVFSNLKAPIVSLIANSGSISQLGSVTATSLTTSSSSGTVLNNSENRIRLFTASNSSSGSIELINVGVIDELDITNSGGDVVVTNTGGIKTKTVSASGAASITANSPLEVGAGGIFAGGNIALTASNLTSSGDMTLNGPVNSSGGSVALNAANSLVQNSSVYGAAGVTVTVGGSLVLGPGASAGALPVSYTVAGLSVTPPPLGGPNGMPIPPVTPISPVVPMPPTEPPIQIEDIQVSNAVVQTNLVTTFMDKFEVALLDQGNDQPGKKRNRNDLVLEGEVCRP